MADNDNSVVVPSFSSGSPEIVKIPEIHNESWDILWDSRVRSWMTEFFRGVYDGTKTTEENCDLIKDYLQRCIKNLSSGITTIMQYMPYIDAIKKLKSIDPIDAQHENT